MKFKFKKFWGDDIISFHCPEDLMGILPEPRPAIKSIPDWFKNLPPTLPEFRDSFDHPMMTAKKCMPLIDSMSLGFTIPLCGDLHVRSNHNCSQVVVQNPRLFNVCDYHKSHQVGGNNKITPQHGDPLKFINYWVVKTAPGWSSLFIPPINQFDSPFVCLSGLVDTDKFHRPVNFPAIWTKPNCDIHLSAGTPLVTVIPIKRNSFNNKKPIIRAFDDELHDYISKTEKIMESRLQYYSSEVRVKK